MPDTHLNPPSSAFMDKLAAIVGDKGMVTDPQAVAFHNTDWRGVRVGRAAAVVKPASVEEVSAIPLQTHQVTQLVFWMNHLRRGTAGHGHRATSAEKEGGKFGRGADSE